MSWTGNVREDSATTALAYTQVFCDSTIFHPIQLLRTFIREDMLLHQCETNTPLVFHPAVPEACQLPHGIG